MVGCLPIVVEPSEWAATAAARRSRRFTWDHAASITEGLYEVSRRGADDPAYRLGTTGHASPADDAPHGEDANDPLMGKIRERAQRVYAERIRDGRPGTPQSDWLQAEREIAAKRTEATNGRPAGTPAFRHRGDLAGQRRIPAGKVSAPGLADRGHAVGSFSLNWSSGPDWRYAVRGRRRRGRRIAPPDLTSAPGRVSAGCSAR